MLPFPEAYHRLALEKSRLNSPPIPRPRGKKEEGGEGCKPHCQGTGPIPPGFQGVKVNQCTCAQAHLGAQTTLEGPAKL